MGKKTVDIPAFYPPLIFAALLPVFYPAVFFHWKVFIVKMSDLHLVNYSWAAYFKAEASKGVFPLWNPLSFCGYPYGASYMSVVNVLNLCTLLFNNVNLAWNVVTLGNVFFAGFFTYLYMSKVGFSRFSATLAGIAFAFTPTSGCSVDSWGSFLPLVLWLSEEYGSSRKIRYLLFLFLSFSTLFLTALPQYSFYIGIFFLFYVWTRLKSVMGAVVLLFATGAVSFYTFRLFEMLSLSGRGQLWFVNVLLPTHLINTVFPFLFESPFRPDTNFFFSKLFYELTRMSLHTDKIQYLFPPYIGVLGFTLLLCSWEERGLAQFYRISVLFMVFYMMTFPILAPIYKWIPLLAQMPRIERLNSVFTFALAILSGIGAEKILASKTKFRPIIAFYISIISVIAGVLLVLRFLVNFRRDSIKAFLTHHIQSQMIGSAHYSAPIEFYLKRINEFFIWINQWTNLLSPSLLLPIIYIILSLSLIYFWQSGKIKKTFFLVGCIFLLSADLLIYFNLTQYSGSSPSELRPNSKVIRFLQHDSEIFRVVPILDDEVFGKGRERNTLAPNANLFYGISTVEGYDPICPGRYSAFFRVFQTNYEKDPAMILGGPEGSFQYSVINFLNVKYFITSKNKKLKNNFLFVLEDENNKLYLNKFYYPRAFMLYDYRVIKNKDEILTYLKNKEMDFHKIVVLEEEPLQAIKVASKEGSAGEVIFEKYTPHFVELNVSTPKPGLLLLTDNYFPGWKALVDNAPVKVLRADYTFRAVAVPQGNHKLKFIYRPLSFVLGLWTSCAFLFMGLAMIVYLVKFKKAVF